MAASLAGALVLATAACKVQLKEPPQPDGAAAIPPAPQATVQEQPADGRISVPGIGRVRCRQLTRKGARFEPLPEIGHLWAEEEATMTAAEKAHQDAQVTVRSGCVPESGHPALKDLARSQIGYFRMDISHEEILKVEDCEELPGEAGWRFKLIYRFDPDNASIYEKGTYAYATVTMSQRFDQVLTACWSVKRYHPGDSEL